MTSWLLKDYLFLCFVAFPYGVLGQVWYLLVSISDLSLHPYFKQWCICYGSYDFIPFLTCVGIDGPLVHLAFCVELVELLAASCIPVTGS